MNIFSSPNKISKTLNKANRATVAIKLNKNHFLKYQNDFPNYFLLIFHWRESFYPYFHLFIFRRKIFWKETQITPNWIWIWNFKQLQMEKWVSNNFKVTSKLFLWNFQLSFFKFWRSHFIFPHELIELLKVSKFEIFQNGIHIIFKPFFISLNGRSHIIFTLGFCDEMNLNSWRS